MEKMTEKEMQKLKELQAKEKRVKRAEKQAEKEHIKYAENHKEELLKKWGIKDELQEIAKLYDCTKQELIAHITSDTQVNYYKRMPRKSTVTPRTDTIF